MSIDSMLFKLQYKFHNRDMDQLLTSVNTKTMRY